MVKCEVFITKSVQLREERPQVDRYSLNLSRNLKVLLSRFCSDNVNEITGPIKTVLRLF